MSEHAGQSESITEAIARVLRGGAVAALATIVDAPEEARLVGKKLLVEEAGGRRAGGTGNGRLDEIIAEQARLFLTSHAEARTFPLAEFAGGAAGEFELLAAGRARVLFERIEPEPHVVVCGAGHVGAALARLSASIGYRVTLVDDRADFVTRERFPETEIALVAAASWERAVAGAVGTGRGVSVAVVTRGHNEDEECMRAVLKARPDYVGMIGSRRRTNIVLARLKEIGYDEELLGEVRAPVGLDIGAVTPAEVALSILAEIIAHRRRGTGAPLSAWRRAK